MVQEVLQEDADSKKVNDDAYVKCVRYMKIRENNRFICKYKTIFAGYIVLFSVMYHAK